MRKLILSVVVPMACLLVTKTIAHPLVSDSVKINHTTDGDISEWKLEKFETDKETSISYAVDHDATNLYLAVKVTDQGEQMKMMMMGMSLYLDKNGKKKEKTGIHFPVKKESGSGFTPRGGGGNGEAPDPKAIRENLAATMIFLKTFGFENQDEEKTQMITDATGVNVSFGWDDANVLYIEYQVPFSLLGQPSSFKEKTLGIGWKVHGMEIPSGAPIGTSIQPVSGGGRGGGGRGGVNTGAGRSGGASFGTSSDARMKEQNIWTKYVFAF